MEGEQVRSLDHTVAHREQGSIQIIKLNVLTFGLISLSS